MTGRRGSQRRRRLHSDSRIPESVHETGDTDRPRAEFQRPSRPSEAARALQRFHLQLPKACVADPVRPRATGMRSEGTTRPAKRVESGSHCSQESHRGQHPKKPGQPAPSPSQSRAWVRVWGIVSAPEGPSNAAPAGRRVDAQGAAWAAARKCEALWAPREVRSLRCLRLRRCCTFSMTPRLPRGWPGSTR